ncbi:MAG: 3-keto-5-aminohexanoate cleavage enzyme [Hyphomicrobiales bacterium]|jgi:3-keto-5-aminohexanoate cleavage enzyme|nr:3-keto-5-aminohexanoate cleavage enzyme [Hyphomicrobiales bacterium]
MKPLIICAAVTGGSPAKSKTPHHPVTPQAVADESVACWRAGAAMVHIHARLEDGGTIMEVGAYRNIVDRIRATGCDAIINLSAGDDGGKADHKMRLSIADSDVEMVSLDAGPINIGNRIYNNSLAYLEEMAGRLKKRNIKPEIEIFDAGHIQAIGALIKKGLLTPPYYMQFVFGVPGGMPADPRFLPLCLAHVPEDTEWAISAQTSDPDTYLALQMPAFVQGGHVRCGMEDYVYLRHGELATSNAQCVEQWTETARIWGRPVASPNDARKILGIG